MQFSTPREFTLPANYCSPDDPCDIGGQRGVHVAAGRMFAHHSTSCVSEVQRASCHHSYGCVLTATRPAVAMFLQSSLNMDMELPSQDADGTMSIIDRPAILAPACDLPRCGLIRSLTCNYFWPAEPPLLSCDQPRGWAACAAGSDGRVQRATYPPRATLASAGCRPQCNPCACVGVHFPKLRFNPFTAP